MFLAKKPKVPPTFEGVDFNDNEALKAAQDAILREQWVKSMMARLVREEMDKCYRKEGVNHLEHCGYLRGLWKPPSLAILDRGGDFAIQLQFPWPTVDLKGQTRAMRTNCWRRTVLRASQGRHSQGLQIPNAQLHREEWRETLDGTPGKERVEDWGKINLYILHVRHAGAMESSFSFLTTNMETPASAHTLFSEKNMASLERLGRPCAHGNCRTPASLWIL
jgi:hypothetical protein